MRLGRLAAVAAILVLVVAAGYYWHSAKRAAFHPRPIAAASTNSKYPFRGVQPSESYMTKLEELKKREGRDNALIYYCLAAWAAPSMNELTAQNDVMMTVLEQGWSPKAEALKPVLEKLQPAFAEVRRGAAVDYAKGIGFSGGPGTEVPNVLIAQLTAKMLCAEGRLFESQNKVSQALDNYLTVLTMGRDYGSPGNMLIAYCIGEACESLALKQVYRLVVSGQLGKASLQKALERLKRIEQTQGKKEDALAGEREMHGKSSGAPDQDSAKAASRGSVLISRLRQTQLATATELSKIEKGRYPESLAALAPSYFARLPLDPYSGTTFHYQVQQGGSRFALSGIGPDERSQSGAIIYDATNGTRSAGDIVMP